MGISLGKDVIFLTLLSIITAILSLINLYSYYNKDLSQTSKLLSLGLSILLILLTIMALLRYRGRKSESKPGHWYSFLSCRYSIIIISLFGNSMVAILLFLSYKGLVKI